MHGRLVRGSLEALHVQIHADLRIGYIQQLSFSVALGAVEGSIVLFVEMISHICGNEAVRLGNATKAEGGFKNGGDGERSEMRGTSSGEARTKEQRIS